MAKQTATAPTNHYSERIQVTVPTTLHLWLREESERQGLPLAGYVRTLIVRAKREAEAAGRD